jgi:hypothetical protein
MKMLIVIFRESLDEEIRRLLRDLDLRAFTEAPKVFGIGEAGMAAGTFEHPGYNSLILCALEDDQAGQVIGGLKSFREKLSRNQRGAKIPMRVFVLPCDQVV